MATKKFLELQEMADIDLQNEITSTEATYQQMKFEHAVKGLENAISLKEVRRDIARLKTEVRRREVAAMPVEEVNKRARLRARRKR